MGVGAEGQEDKRGKREERMQINGQIDNWIMWHPMRVST